MTVWLPGLSAGLVGGLSRGDGIDCFTVVGGVNDRLAATAGDAPIPRAVTETAAMTRSRRMSSCVIISSFGVQPCSVVTRPWFFRAFRHK